MAGKASYTIHSRQAVRPPTAFDRVDSIQPPGLPPQAKQNKPPPCHDVEVDETTSHTATSHSVGTGTDSSASVGRALRQDRHRLVGDTRKTTSFRSAIVRDTATWQSQIVSMSEVPTADSKRQIVTTSMRPLIVHQHPHQHRLDHAAAPTGNCLAMSIRVRLPRWHCSRIDDRASLEMMSMPAFLRHGQDFSVDKAVLIHSIVAPLHVLREKSTGLLPMCLFLCRSGDRSRYRSTTRTMRRKTIARLRSHASVVCTVVGRQRALPHRVLAGPNRSPRVAHHHQARVAKVMRSQSTRKQRAFARALPRRSAK